MQWWSGEVLLSAGAIGPRPYLLFWEIPVAYHQKYVGPISYVMIELVRELTKRKAEGKAPMAS
jgi:hypothetical protein